MSSYKQVNLIVTVSEGDYCWDAINNRICEHFDNEGGHPNCALSHLIGYQSVDYDKKGRVEKTDKCKGLQEVAGE